MSQIRGEVGQQLASGALVFTSVIRGHSAHFPGQGRSEFREVNA